MGGKAKPGSVGPPTAWEKKYKIKAARGADRLFSPRATADNAAGKPFWVDGLFNIQVLAKSLSRLMKDGKLYKPWLH
ncbi:MAG: hypothetical protein ACLPJH_16750 [Myxococcaceae bacterium]